MQATSVPLHVLKGTGNGPLPPMLQQISKMVLEKMT